MQLLSGFAAASLLAGAMCFGVSGSASVPSGGVLSWPGLGDHSNYFCDSGDGLCRPGTLKCTQSLLYDPNHNGAPDPGDIIKCSDSH